MTRSVAIVLLLMSSAICLLAENDAVAARDAKLIQQLKQIPVSQLDLALPPVSFEKWLRVEAGADADFHWEVNDCGEETGSPADQGRDFPMCVEAQANLKDHRTIVVSIAVGTFKKGASGKPTVSFVQLVTPRETIDIHHLSGLPAALIRTHVPAQPEIAR